MLKSELRGRALQIRLCSGRDNVINDLVKIGLSPDRAEQIGEAALKFADNETEAFVQQLSPKSAWQGTVVLRRYENLHKGSSWLVLKHIGDEGWLLEAALFG